MIRAVEAPIVKEGLSDDLPPCDFCNGASRVNVARLETLAGMALLFGGLMLAVASVTSVGAAQSWDVADAFAADSVRPLRRMGMLLGAVGLGVVVAATPVLVVRAAGTDGFAWIAAGWIGFAFGATLFAMAFGLTAIMMPALGELAEIGAVSPQQVADRLTRQVPIVAAFAGGNLTFLSWVPIGVGLVRVAAFPTWVGWFVALAALSGWLSFLHVPVFQRVAGPLWPLAVTLSGVLVLRSSGSAD